MKKRRGTDYGAIRLNDSDIADGTYKLQIGSGQAWHSRGAFQLVLLRSLGLMPHHRFLDYGCGPVRGGFHLIKFLDPGNYTGLDINPDYIKVARRVVAEQELFERNPLLALTGQYHDKQQFDFCLLFSVLNHCTPEEVGDFFRFIATRINPDGAICITHAGRISPGYYDSAFHCSRVLSADDFRIEDFGWRSRDEIFPVIELRPKG